MTTWTIAIDWDRNGNYTDTYDDVTNRVVKADWFLGMGQQNKEVAAQLVISERTVKFHVSSILGKLDAGNRTEAVRIAAQRGLINL